jgi:tRNA pseudouridine55 synthase
MESCGILPVYKPQGPTSHDIVARARRLFGTHRIGHTGTLDPMAEGLLLLCLGRATKIVRFLIGMDKTYLAGIRLGGRTTTGDAAGEMLETGDPQGVTREQVEEVLTRYRGTIQQRVPAHSAVKVRGRRLYAYARKGGDVPEVVREVEIQELTLDSFANPDLTVTVRSSGGTYIRALARDIGEDLGCGGYLASLTRTKIGEYDCAGVEQLSELEKLPSAEEYLGRLRPFEDYLPFPRVIVGNDKRGAVYNGSPLAPQTVIEVTGSFARGATLLLCDEQRQGLAIITAQCESSSLADFAGTDWFRYERVLT